MHLAYLDDSDTKAKCRKWQVMAGVLIPDCAFAVLEMAMGLVQSLVIPEESASSFTEFHACELYGGYGIFQPVDQEQRFFAITKLLGLLAGRWPFPVVYGAVDIDSLKDMVYASADPLDMSFRMCADGIQSWVNGRIWKKAEIDPTDGGEKAASKFGKSAMESFVDELVLLIVDDCDRKTKDVLYKTFRDLRPRKHVPKDAGKIEMGKLVHFHDDMYFGDSRHSIGIQLADLCAYFIARHLEGDAEIDGFYKLIEPHIVSSKVYPEDKMPKVVMTKMKELFHEE